MPVEIRAKSTLKLSTGVSNIDYEYRKGTDLKSVARHVLYAIQFNDGVEDTREFVNAFLDEQEKE